MGWILKYICPLCMRKEEINSDHLVKFMLGEAKGLFCQACGSKLKYAGDWKGYVKHDDE